MHTSYIVRSIALGVLALVLSTDMGVADDGYPVRPVRFIVSFPPGGSADLVARTIQPSVEARLGRPLIVDNRPGAGGIIGIDAVAKSAPDGYLIGLGGAGALAVNLNPGERMSYDPLKELAPISLLAKIPLLLIASSAAAGSLEEVIVRAKARPDALSIGHGGNGTTMHLTAQLFNHTAGIKLTLVPYKGSGPVAADVLAGHIPLGIVDIPSALALVQAGRIRALAVSTADRVAALPDVPTFAEAGLPGFEAVGWFGTVAPAGTPPGIIARLNAALVAALEDPTVAERTRLVGVEPAPTSPDAFGRFIRAEAVKWSNVIARAGATDH